MTDCTWQTTSDGQWQCTACGRTRRWTGDGPPPRRNCLQGRPAAGVTSAPTSDPLACVHRGQVARYETCQGCKDSTFELPVYSCALRGECTLHNYAARNPQLGGLKICAACPDRKPGQPKLPSSPARAARYAKAWAIDRATGKPRRPAEIVARLFADHCRPCPHFNAVESACAKCGCPVRPEVREDNKLAWGNETCPDDRWPIQVANLIFYLLPLKNPARVWQWHVEQLCQRLSLFNGRKIITIATAGPGEILDLDSPADVIKAFGDDAAAIEFIERPNDPRHWETPAFRNMLQMLRTGRRAAYPEGPVDPAILGALLEGGLPAPRKDSATFYFHAKGVRRANQAAVRPWCEKIYEHNLDRWDDVRELLVAYPMVGIAKIPAVNHAGGGGQGWHFAGTGFWFRDEALFARPTWSEITDHSHAVEMYPMMQFDPTEAYCLAYDSPTNVYSGSTWHDKALEARHTPPPTARVSVLVVSRNYARYLRQCLESVLAQTYPLQEIVYVDDASDDDSLAIAGEFKDRIKIVALPRVGAAEARNRAVKYATGDAILFVDGDNWLPPDYVWRMAHKLEPGVPFVYPDIDRFGDLVRYDRAPEWEAVDLTRRNSCDTCSLMWRESFDKVGGWKESWLGFDDWHLMLRLSRLGRPARAGVALHYRVHGQSVTESMHRQLSEAELDDLARRLVADALG